jgi:hypothetical protein
MSKRAGRNVSLQRHAGKSMTERVRVEALSVPGLMQSI